MTTLDKSYTVPMTLEEWVQCVPWLKDDPIADEIDKCAFVAFYAFGEYTVATKPNDGMVRVSVPRFLDLLHDRITPWRLEEIGGQRYGNNNFYGINLPEHRCVIVHFENRVLVDARQLDKGLNIPNITTFNDLLTLIRFLTPNTNKP